MVWTGVNWIGLLILAYLMGSFPTAYLMGRLLKGVDIRTLGDGNAGAANAFRVLGAPAGLTVGVVDAGKGIAALLLARQLAGGGGVEMLAGVAAVGGHNWPFFLQFRGGRGACTALGVLEVLLPRALLPLSLVALIPLGITRSTTVALSFIFIPLPLVAWYSGASYTHIGYAVALPLLVGMSHHLSLKRTPLKPGLEPSRGPYQETGEVDTP